MDLKKIVWDESRIFKMYKSRLEKLGITTIEDFLYYVPFRYIDTSLISKISQVQEGEQITIQGEIIDIKNEYTRHGKKLQKAIVKDDTGVINVIWFNQPYIAKILQIGNNVSLFGKIGKFLKNLTLESPEYEIITKNETIHTGRLVPVYPETKGITSKWIRRQVFNLLQKYKTDIVDFLPTRVKSFQNLMDLNSALQEIHFPKNLESAKLARFRLAYEEVFLLQLHNFIKRDEWNKNLISHPFSISKHAKQLDECIKQLPFILTNAQKKAVNEICKDLSDKKPMNRLLEGDVGSGKTVVSAIAMYVTYLNGFQSVLMAPTEILAQQHYKTISNLLSSLCIRVDLRTGSSKYKVLSIKQKKSASLNTKYQPAGKQGLIHNTEFDILIGTHAVLSDKVAFERLGLVVIDEQQRFGVKQRGILRKKGKNPHLLTMTATPIPRTIALTLYGDLDLSYLDEMPKGRKKIKTWLVGPEKRSAAYDWIKKQVKETDSQVFIICPFIEESENMQTVKAATKEYERLKKEVFPDLRLALLHGKMKAKEKDEILQQFKDKKYDILVATPVVEVGIDVANATIMLIEASERFGLSQLHQLRGRVGRGDKQSYCLLFTDSTNKFTTQRLKAMEIKQNGAELAELDFRLRGPGELYGTMQHGRQELKIARFSDLDLIQKARKDAESIFHSLSQHIVLSKRIRDMDSKAVSPD